jgi:hypothetical protein
VIEDETGVFNLLLRHTVTGIASGNSFATAGVLEVTHETAFVVDSHVSLRFIIVLYNLVVARGTPQFAPTELGSEVHVVLKSNALLELDANVECLVRVTVRGQAVFIGHNRLGSAVIGVGPVLEGRYSEIQSAVVVAGDTVDLRM